jgi:hypothetical protein
VFQVRTNVDLGKEVVHTKTQGKWTRYHELDKNILRKYCAWIRQLRRIAIKYHAERREQLGGTLLSPSYKDIDAVQFKDPHNRKEIVEQVNAEQLEEETLWGSQGHSWGNDFDTDSHNHNHGEPL